MSFYGQIINQIKGSINKINVKNKVESTSYATVENDFTLCGDGVITPVAEDGNTIKMQHNAPQSEDKQHEFKVLIWDDTQQQPKQIYNLEIDKYGHTIVKPASDTDTNLIWSVKEDSDHPGAIIFE